MAAIKEVVSVSIGSSRRDHEVEIELLGERFRLRREGTDGDMNRAVERIAELDGTIAAFGLGGVDLFLRAAGRSYYFRDGMRIVRAARKTPILDGTGLKGAVESSVVPFMRDEVGLELAGKKVLLVSAVDRWGVAEGFHAAGCEMTYGDLLYGLDLPIMIHRWPTLVRVVRTLMPVVRLLPFSFLYPTGEKQNEDSKPGHEDIYRDNDIIAGDYVYIHKFMPKDMTGKWIVTNTTTAADVEDMRKRGVELLVTSTPRLEGRSFGTNVIEATLVALKGADRELSAEEYMSLMREVGFKPDVRWLQREG